MLSRTSSEEELTDPLGFEKYNHKAKSISEILLYGKDRFPQKT